MFLTPFRKSRSDSRQHPAMKALGHKTGLPLSIAIASFLVQRRFFTDAPQVVSGLLTFVLLVTFLWTLYEYRKVPREIRLDSRERSRLWITLFILLAIFLVMLFGTEPRNILKF